MAIQSRNTLKSWFRRGLKPLAVQFGDWIDSFWHKNEKIPIGSIEQLGAELNNKASTESVSNLEERVRELESGSVVPDTEVIILTDTAPTYTVSTDTASDVNISSQTTNGSVLLPVLQAAKAITFIIPENSNNIAIGNTEYPAATTLFAFFDIDTVTWTVNDTVVPDIPGDVSEVSVKIAFDNPEYTAINDYIKFETMEELTAGELVFIKSAADSSIIGVWSVVLVEEEIVTLSKLVLGEDLNTVRVASGDNQGVWQSMYNGNDSATLIFLPIIRNPLAFTFSKKGVNGEVAPNPFKWFENLKVKELIFQNNIAESSFSAKIGEDTYEKDSIAGAKIAVGESIDVSFELTAGSNQGSLTIIFEQL